MGLWLIKGRFFVTHYSPDGDSVRFRANNKGNWALLGTGPLQINQRDDVQLRFEGIDALETHYTNGGAEDHQPLGLARQARDFVLSSLSFSNVVWNVANTAVVSVASDGQPGYILAKKKDDHGRPIVFAYAGAPAENDGDDVYVDASRLKESINYQLIERGLAYPFYFSQSGLFASLRNEMSAAVATARAANRGVYAQDRTNSGVTVTTTSVITDTIPLFPRLFRRLADFLEGNPVNLSGFKSFLAQQNTRVVVQSPFEETGFDNLIDVQSQVVKLLQPPENLLFLE